MNENINLCEILNRHEGETFYSPCFGYVRLDIIDYPFITVADDANGISYRINSTGLYTKDGEVCIFPSKDQRDWNKWIEDQKHKVPKTWSELCKKTSCNPLSVTACYDDSDCSFTESNTPIEKSALALIKILQLIEVGYGGNVLYNKEGHWDGGIYGYTISIRPSSKRYLDGYEIIPIERRNDVVSPIMFKTKEYAQEFIKHEENCSLLRIFNMVAYPRDIK